MNNTMIKVDNLSKQYRIGAQKAPYKTIRETLTGMVQAPVRRVAKLLRGHAYGAADLAETIWALQDVSFEVKRGEVVGVIGCNGAGKTTLLKILSRITEPTGGVARIYGRVNSLLEVGTGFHPELTGRENIFLNGAILGMKKREITKKFDEIVAFAEIQKFIDTPVKFYSSGMYVRLAFAVAAHMEPEILLVDEVLAVGDVAFRRKCLGKMRDVASSGRTILFVSHNMPSIINLCQRAILLNEGKIVSDGKAADVVEHYLASSRSIGGEVVWSDIAQAPGNEIVRLHAVRILQDGIEEPTSDVDISKEILVQISYCNLDDGALLYANLILKDQMGNIVFSSSNHKFISLTVDPWYSKPQPKGFFQSICRIPGDFLNEGFYSVTVVLGKEISNTQVIEENALSFHVYDTGEMRKEFFGGWGGVVRPKLSWYTEYVGLNHKDCTRC